jgi:hypothetical protein
MSAPTARTFRLRRLACLYIPAFILGALAVLASVADPIFNSADLLGIVLLTAATAGVVLETRSHS